MPRGKSLPWPHNRHIPPTLTFTTPSAPCEKRSAAAIDADNAASSRRCTCENIAPELRDRDMCNACAEEHGFDRLTAFDDPELSRIKRMKRKVKSIEERLQKINASISQVQRELRAI